MTLEFRRPKSDEAGAMAALHVQCWREAYANILPEQLLSTFTDETQLPMWQVVIPSVDRFVLAAYVDGKVVGFVISGATDEKHIENQDGHLWSLYIAADYGRRGIGRHLISCVAADWMEKGGTSLTIGVLAENIRARSFYESLGARLVQLCTYEWDGYLLPDTIYVFENLPALTP